MVHHFRMDSANETYLTGVMNEWIHEVMTNFGYENFKRLSLPIFVYQPDYVSQNSSVFLEFNFTVDGKNS